MNVRKMTQRAATVVATLLVAVAPAVTLAPAANAEQVFPLEENLPNPEEDLLPMGSTPDVWRDSIASLFGSFAS
ncbi:hypothetical protein [Rhodococcus sp. NPDC049939]|uniref:hypothetical protein n=1 Tax=Rhodococcus sp. NPDC049939 TaxID=3155511 RepID=UPI0033DD3D33